jgi:predicted nucleic acid-binding protein
MQVYMLPVGSVTPSGYELYCETPDEPVTDAASAEGRGFFKSLVAKFREMLAAAEHERRAGRRTAHHGDERRRWTRRLKDRAIRWVAEAVAEQRLLWHLRRQTHATLFHPSDLAPPVARGMLNAALQRDADRHIKWLIVDTLGMLAAAALIIIPGPNILGYYFAFRVVGHYLSWRGARQGLRWVEWREQPSPALAELRQVPALDDPARAALLERIAAALGLEHLPAFFDRLAIS